MAPPNRNCRRKHWRAWQLKILGDGETQIVSCPICGSEGETKVPGSPNYEPEREAQ